MQYRGVVLSRGLVFFCVASLFMLGLFVVPAIAQDTGAGPPESTPAPGTDTNGDTSLDLATIAANNCTVSPGASVTLSDYDGTRARFVDGRLGIEITATGNQLRIQGPPDESLEQNAVEKFPDESFFNDGDWTVVTTTGITCQGTGAANQQPADDNANAAQSHYNAAEDQYGKVIKKTIPHKRILIKTGGPSLPMIGGAILAIGLAGLGIFLLRRT
jgi:hypothetical protein